MSHKPERQFPDDLSQVYSRLNQLDVEQFYTGYQWWIAHRRINILQEEIDTLRIQIDENAQYMQHARPPAVALATLARLQANGVDDLDLLDRMLEQGEEWLDLIMQRLDYCEQLDFIHDNYTQWCEHALEGAYDWIDSMRVAEIDTLPPPETASDIEATEELLLRKLTSEEEGEIPTTDAPVISGEEYIQEQVAQATADAEAAKPEATLATEVEDAVDLPTVPMTQESEQQPVELSTVPEVSLVEPEAEVQEPITVIEQTMEEQRIEAVQASEAAHVAEENGPSAASFERESQQQAVELALKLETLSSTEVEVDEASLALEGNAEVETLEVLTNDVAPEEDTGVDALQEMPFSIEIDAAAPVEEPLPTEIDEQDTTSEARSEEHEVEAAGSEGLLPDEVNIESEAPVEEGLVIVGAASDIVPEASGSQENAEPTPAQDQQPRRKRSFWEFLLGLPGH
jgi:hypothetical protein